MHLRANRRQRRAQFVRGVGEEALLSFAKGGQPRQQLVDGIEHRPQFLVFGIGAGQRRRRLHIARGNGGGQRRQGLQGAAVANAQQQHDDGHSSDQRHQKEDQDLGLHPLHEAARHRQLHLHRRIGGVDHQDAPASLVGRRVGADRLRQFRPGIGHRQQMLALVDDAVGQLAAQRRLFAIAMAKLAYQLIDDAHALPGLDVGAVDGGQRARQSAQIPVQVAGPHTGHFPVKPGEQDQPYRQQGAQAGP